MEDTCTREVVAWDLLISCEAADAFRVVGSAVLARFPLIGRVEAVILKTDGNSQFNAHSLQDRCRGLGLNLETRPKCCLFNGHFKIDYIYTHEPMTYAETRLARQRNIRHYNDVRTHYLLDYLIPRAFYEAKTNEAKG